MKKGSKNILPILFNTEMVRAILEGRKTVTRRVVTPQPPAGVTQLYHGAAPGRWRSPGKDVWVEIRAPYQPGDILWVREIWSPVYVRPRRYIYKADVDRGVGEGVGLPLRWHHPNKMPWEAARIFLRVTGVRVERLQEISYADVIAEGVPYGHAEYTKFRAVWNSTIKPKDLPVYGWDANPWVWVIEFERISKEEAEQFDQIRKDS